MGKLVLLGLMCVCARVQVCVCLSVGQLQQKMYMCGSVLRGLSFCTLVGI